MSGVDTVLVMGPPMSGASAVAATLRRRLTDCRIVDTAGGAGPPDVVVFVVSAAAPVAGCDAALLDVAAAQTDTVVAAVAKIDVHRIWRRVLESNRAALARHAPRYRATPWVGVAADPRVGPMVIDPLVDAVRTALGDRRRAERNRLRAAEHAAVVRAQRAARRQEQAAQRNTLRAQVRQTRLDLAAQARARAVTLRAELQQQAAVASHREIGGFDQHVRSRVSQCADDFDDLLRGRFAELCRGQGLAVPDVALMPPAWDGMPPRHRPATDSVTVVFATTFGLGVALTLGRLLLEIVGSASPWPLAGCGAAGVALAVWMVRTRRLATARLVLDRWVAEVSAGLRSALEDRVLVAESSLLAALAEEGRSPN